MRKPPDSIAQFCSPRGLCFIASYPLTTSRNAKRNRPDTSRLALFSESESHDDAVAGTELMSEIKEKMGDLWPDKGFIEYEAIRLRGGYLGGKLDASVEVYAFSAVIVRNTAQQKHHCPHRSNIWCQLVSTKYIYTLS
ncbi:Pc22g01160 [Penicillium rubens Wisconsin 54-1255]|uniref:Pc22g01160 protein n=1 Tax=Penicillium rubens (strain ATCC 28089 / DSM 1075 / NRRL 1951 / Wisconsin 54-1255) TaxID=500485 RepID=B6HP01_PENRW|nr:Pc22g01160 [Penicillium rubens Wisconsin 54-1255]